MANLRVDNLSGSGGRNAIDGSVYFRGYIDGTVADWLQTADLDDYDMGTGDFTFECWVKAAESSGEYAGIFGMYNYDNAGMLIQINHLGKIRLVNPNDLDQSGSTVIIPQDGSMGSWHHIAVVRSGTTLKAFVNGVEEISHTYSAGIDFANGGAAVIGVTDRNDYPGDYDLKGYISNLRLIKGTALYTAAFTPPTEKLTAVAGTVLLCCQDSDNSTQEATGKTITAYGSLQSSDDEELVTNGGFANNINGWTTSGVQWTHSNSALMHFGNGNTQRNAYQNVTTVVGKRYVARVMASSAEGSTAYWQIAGSTINYVADNNNSAQIEYIHHFTATSTSTQIRFYSYDSGNSSNVRSYWYNASIKLLDQPKAPKVLPPVGVDEGVVFTGDTKVNSQGYMYFPTGDTAQRGRGRGFRFGGDSGGGKQNYIEYVNIQSQGNAQDFGDLLTTLTQAHGGSSSIRTIIFAGYNAPANVADIQYFTNATQGNSIDAGINVGGDFTRYCNVVSSETRSVYGGGTPGYTATMEYVTNASLGSVTDFADFTEGGMYSAGTMNSTTRGIFAGGYYASPVGQSTRIQYITIATTADSISFGDLTQAMGGPHGICSSPTRGIMWDGANTIDYVTIASTGNAKDFGEATVDGFNSGVSFSSHTRACAGGGYNQATPGSGGNDNRNYIDYVTIASTGNAKDFGDLRTIGSSMGGSSDCHGGLS